MGRIAKVRWVNLMDAFAKILLDRNYNAIAPTKAFVIPNQISHPQCTQLRFGDHNEKNFYLSPRPLLPLVHSIIWQFIIDMNWILAISFMSHESKGFCS